MVLPDFNDFLATLKGENAERFTEITRSQSEPADLKELAKTIAKTNYLLSVELLRLYHNWLAQHLELPR